MIILINKWVPFRLDGQKKPKQIIKEFNTFLQFPTSSSTDWNPKSWIDPMLSKVSFDPRGAWVFYDIPCSWHPGVHPEVHTTMTKKSSYPIENP